jgi:hypothetical protein
MEYYFFLNTAGRVSLAPFSLSVPAPEIPEDPEKTGDARGTRRIRFPSPAIQFLIRAPSEAGSGRSSPERNLRLSWEGRPSQLHMGEEAELTLVHQGWDPRLPLPSPGFLIPRTPIGAILEAVPPREDDEAARILLRLRLIPLEEGRLNIPGFNVSLGDYRLDIPALSIPVVPAGDRGQPAPAAAAGPPPEEEPAPPASGSPARGDLPFPETILKPLSPFRAGCGSIRERARALWNKGLRVEALAELRRNERDYAGGPALIPLRRDAEKLLGLSGNGDETWRPRTLLTAIILVSAILAVAFLFLSFLPLKMQVTPGLAWCYKGIGNFKKPARAFRTLAVFFAFPAVLSLWRLGDLPAIELPFPGVSGPARPALTRETEIFRIPGPEGTVTFRLEEGRRVLVRSVRGDWAYAEIPGPGEGGKNGWLRSEALVFY